MKNKLFLNNIITHKEKIRGINYSNSFDSAIDFSALELFDIEIEYAIYINKNNVRDQLIVLDFAMTEKKNDKNVKDHDKNEFELGNDLSILIECNYEVHKNIPKNKIDEVMDNVAISRALSYLRNVLFGISSYANVQPIVLPDIDLNYLLMEHKRKQNKKPSRQVKKKSKSPDSKN